MATRSAPSRVGEVRFKLETVAGEAIGTASTFWAASPKLRYAWDVSAKLNTAMMDDPSLRMRAFEDPKRIALAKECGISFKTMLDGLASQTAADTVAITSDDLGGLLKGAFGGQSLGTSHSVDPTNTGLGSTAPLKLVAATGLAIGDALYVVTTNEMRRIVNVSGVNVTLDMNLSAIPTTGLAVACDTSYLDQDSLCDMSNGGHLTFAGLFRGYDAEDQFQIRGGFPSVELGDIGAKKAAHLAIDLHGIGGEFVTGVAVGTRFTQATVPPQKGGGLYLTTIGTTRRYIETSSIDIKLGIKAEAYESPTGEEGIANHGTFSGRTTVEFETLMDTEWWIAQEAGTEYFAGYHTRCATGVGGWGLSFGRLILTDPPERVGGGATFTRVKCKFHADEAAAGATDLALSRVSLHRYPKL